MKNLVQLKAIFNEDKGLEIETTVIPVIKENDKAIVIETEDFITVYKGKKESEYRDHVNEPYIDRTPIGTGNIYLVRGFYTDVEKAEKSAKEEVKKFLNERVKYYNDLVTLFLHKK